MHTMLIEGERRCSPRVWLEQPCKIHEPRSGRYIAGCTRNVSETGLLIDLPRVLDLKPGESLYIGVACKRRQGLIRADQMLKATIMRTVHTVDDHTLLGLHLDDAQHALEAEGLRLAA